MALPRITRALGMLSLAAAVTFAGLPSAQAAVLDTDGDKIPDSWEMHGKDTDGDGDIDLNFPAWGASPYKKDIFVEMDYMLNLQATDAEMDRITQVFASYPIGNPDGTTGINIHLDAGPTRSDKYNLGGGNQVEHKGLNGMGDTGIIKSTNMDDARKNVFHYMIWGDYYGNNGSSGLGYINGLEFIVTTGPTYWGWNSTNSNFRVGTFVHELGHNLGLLHGGTDNVNYKPNYMSVMNYSYQLDGVPRSNGAYFGYSIRSMGPLNESSLNERRGFGASAIGYLYNRLTANRNVDFNRNGVIDADPVQKDLNGDGQFSILSGPNDMMTLRFQPRITAEGEAAGVGPTPRVEENELTYKDAVRMGHIEEELGAEHSHDHSHEGESADEHAGHNH